MNLNNKKILALVCLILTLVFTAGCGAEQTPYEINDAEGYTVSVKYDANGGVFTTNTSVIVDSYNVSELGTKGEGKAEIALLSPDNAARGNDAFTAINNGHFLAGWYAERTETTDSEGNTVYTYSGKWDFENDRLAVDPSGDHSASEPVLTLYAAWVPLFQIEFYSLESGEYMNAYTFNPITDGDIRLPALDEESGSIELYDFPENPGYTFNGAYYDAAGTQAVTTELVEHLGTVNQETGTAENPVMKLYVDWMEGEWYHIYNVEQFLDNASVSGSYVIHADLDFTDEIWPSSLMYGNFKGTIQGNGHTFSNITIEQTNNSKVNAGLFGNLTEDASVSDLKLENLTFTIKAGTRVAGASYGLFAGSVSDKAEISGVEILSGTLQVDSGCYFGSDDYVIGLVSGMGTTGIDASNVTTAGVGDAPETVVISVDGEEVSVEFVTE